MRRTSKRVGQNVEQDNKTALPPLAPSDFSARLEDLLGKVSIQNRYAHRISQCNIKNMEELQRAKEELQRLEDQRKMKQLRAGSEHDLLEQVMRRVNSSEDELKNVFKELVDAKREIKTLKKEISDLQKTNLQLERHLMIARRDRYYQISIAKDEIEGSLLATEVKAYLTLSQKISSPLYQHCLTAFKKNDFRNFLFDLQRKIQSQQRQESPPVCNRYLREGHSGVKLRLSGVKREKRFRTQHISHNKLHT